MLYQVNEQNDLLNVLAALDGFSEGFGLSDLTVDIDKVEAILKGMRQDFPAQGGSAAASPFKKAANFLCYFVAEGPVKNPFSASTVGGEIGRINNHQNAMAGLHIAIDALHNATIHRKDGAVTLSGRIQLSKHSYVDTIQALAKIQPISHFHLVSVFLEQLCYRFNPNASYCLDV